MTPEALDPLTSGDGWYIADHSINGRVEKDAGVTYHRRDVAKAHSGVIFGGEDLTADVSLKGSKITKIEK